MPVTSCEKDGKPGFKWGDQGFCYTYNPASRSSKELARKKAAEQGKAIKASNGN